MADYLEEQACSRARAAYPETIHRILPTRLGNVLRRHEDNSGRQYGIDTITVAPHLRLTADPAHYTYVEDEGDQLDFALRVCILALAATVVTVAILIPAGRWTALAIAPYTVAYIAYRGAVVAASSYATAVSTVVDLNRFELYDRLHLAHPRSLAAEIQRSEDLMSVLNGERLPPGRDLRFIPKQPPG